MDFDFGNRGNWVSLYAGLLEQLPCSKGKILGPSQDIYR
jgi:hypothetical protein